LLAALLSLASCAPERKYRAVVALDEAFVAAYPSLSVALAKPTAFKGPLEAALGKPTAILKISMSQGAGPALDAVRAAESGGSRPAALVASPLVAAALLGGGVWKGSPPLLVPEWRGKPASGMLTASTDPVPAYRRAGAALGAYIEALAGEGGSPVCGILFQQGPSRPRSALLAFAEAFAQTSNGTRLLVRELTADSGDAAAPPAQAGAAPAPAEDTAPAAAPSPAEAPSPVEAQAKPLGPEAAVKEMLESDLRALFVAIGPESIAAIRAATRPGMALGADYPGPDGLKVLSFRIAPDSEAIVEALDRGLGALGEGLGGPIPSDAQVPARLEIGSPASLLTAGGRSLAAFLRGGGSEGAR
jgi:hypothetical protein